MIATQRQKVTQVKKMTTQTAVIEMNTNIC